MMAPWRSDPEVKAILALPDKVPEAAAAAAPVFSPTSQ